MTCVNVSLEVKLIIGASPINLDVLPLGLDYHCLQIATLLSPKHTEHVCIAKTSFLT